MKTWVHLQSIHCSILYWIPPHQFVPSNLLVISLNSFSCLILTEQILESDLEYIYTQKMILRCVWSFKNCEFQNSAWSLIFFFNSSVFLSPKLPVLFINLDNSSMNSECVFVIFYVNGIICFIFSHIPDPIWPLICIRKLISVWTSLLIERNSLIILSTL